MSSRKRLVAACLIFIVAFAVRSLHAVDLSPVVYTEDQPFSGLTIDYDQRAESILRGEGLLSPAELQPGETRWLSKAPGYSIFLSSIYSLFGRDFFTAQTVQNLINSLSPVLLFLFTALALSWRVGMVAGLLAALSHHLGYLSNLILPDSLCPLPILMAMLCIARASRATRLRWPLFLAAGTMIGLASWLRPQSLALGPFLALALLIPLARKRGKPRLATQLAAMAAVSLLIILPITVANYRNHRAFIPISIGVGLNLWQGIADASGDRFGAEATDGGVANQEAELYGDPRYAESWSTPDGITRDRDRTQKSLEIIKSHPFWYAGSMLARCGQMFKYSANAPLVYSAAQAGDLKRIVPPRKIWRSLANVESPPAVGEQLGWLRPVIRPLQRVQKEAMLLVIALGVLALFTVSWRRSLVLAGVPFYYLIFQSAMHCEFRYTLPMQFFVLVFAAAGWVVTLAAVRSAATRLIRRGPRQPKESAEPAAPHRARG